MDHGDAAVDAMPVAHLQLGMIPAPADGGVEIAHLLGVDDRLHPAGGIMLALSKAGQSGGQGEADQGAGDLQDGVHLQSPGLRRVVIRIGSSRRASKDSPSIKSPPKSLPQTSLTNSSRWIRSKRFGSFLICGA